MTVDLQVATLLYSDADGEHTFALDRPSTSIGRSPGQDIVLHDAHISRQHAFIVKEGASHAVIDQKSSYGTFVNGVRVERATLHDGDVLQLGSLDSSRLRFRLPSTHDAAGDRQPSSATHLLTSLHGFRRNGDDTERPAAHEIGQLNWLLSAARQLNAGGAITDILTTLLELTLQLTGVERGFVFLKEGDEMRLARGLNADGQLIQEDSTVSQRAMQRAIDSESKFSISDTLTDHAASAWASVMANRIRSIYCIPLRKREPASPKDTLLGLLYLDSQIGPGHLSEVDHQLLDTIATEAAALLHNALLAEAEYKARLVREELAVAAKIQSGLMSIALPVLPYAVLQARSVPCLEIGGDFFTAVALDDCLCAGIADISGKGVSAAIVAATLQGIIHAQTLSRQSLSDIAAQLNQFLYTRQVGKYATMVLLKLYSDGRVEYMNCGHVQPLIVRGKKVERLTEGNPIVGLLPEVSYTSAECTLQPGERLLLVTDGLVEAENEAGEPFGDAGLDRIAHLEDVDAILDRVAAYHAPNPAEDDCTLLEVEYTGSRASAPIEAEITGGRSHLSSLSSRPHRAFRAAAIHSIEK
ncbi:MAG: SpoIIE family protein phosphatase [Terracidiphilus sp.]